LLDSAKSQGNNLGKENLDRVKNNARWLNEMKYELDSHREILKRLGPVDPKNEVELRKSSDKLIDLENSIRYSFGRDDYDPDNIG
jgi:hypothetical protein